MRTTWTGPSATTAIRLVVLVAIALASTGCAGPPRPRQPGQATRSASPTPSTVATPPTPTTAKTTSAPLPNDPLTGFGALDEVWKSRHIEDAGRFQPGSSYDHNRFGGVLHLDGRVMAFDINLPPGTPIEAAQISAIEQLPKDSAIIWSKTLDECIVTQVRSGTLARVLHPRWSPFQGYVQVEYPSVGYGTPFNPRDVRTAIVVDGFGNPGDYTVC